MTRPRWLDEPDLPPAAADFWKAHARRLHRHGYLHSSDLESFRMLCSLAAISRKLTDDLVNEGVLNRTAAGAKVHPALAALLAVQRHARPLMKRFRL